MPEPSWSKVGAENPRLTQEENSTLSAEGTANAESRPHAAAERPATGFAAFAARIGPWQWAAAFAILLYLALFVYCSVTRTRQFSPDSMNYVDVARNLATGRGLVQSTLGYNQIYLFSADATIPVPFTTQPPVFPLLIALTSCVGPSYADAALVVPGIAYGLVLLLGYLLGRDLYDETTALLAVAFLLIYQPLNFVAGFAWSEIVSVLFVLLSLWLLAKMGGSNNAAPVSSPHWGGGERILESGGGEAAPALHTSTSPLPTGSGARGEGQARSSPLPLALFSGLACGMAFATRYALIPLFVLGLIFIAWEFRRSTRLPATLFLYAVGFGIPAGLVMAHNWVSTGALLPPAFASDRDLISNLSDTLWSLFGDYSPIGGSEIQAGAAAIMLVLLTLGLALQKRLRDLAAIFLGNGRALLSLWTIGYLVFIVGLRTVSYFSPIDDRLTVPGGTPLVILFAALCSHVVNTAAHSLQGRRRRMANDGEQFAGADTALSRERIRSSLVPRAAYGTVTAVGLVLSFGQLEVIGSLPPFNLEQTIAGSERLTWISNETTNRDLVIGDDTMDVPFYLGRDQAVSFSAYPHTVFFTYQLLTQFAEYACPRYDNLFLVLRDHSDWTYKDQLHLYGRFISDLGFGRLGNYPSVVPLKQLNDGSVFQVRCPR